MGAWALLLLLLVGSVEATDVPAKPEGVTYATDGERRTLLC